MEKLSQIKCQKFIDQGTMMSKTLNLELDARKKGNKLTFLLKNSELKICPVQAGSIRLNTPYTSSAQPAQNNRQGCQLSSIVEPGVKCRLKEPYL